MKTSDFNFELPPGLVAQEPPPERGQSRLFVLDRAKKERRHCMVKELPAILSGGCFLSRSGKTPLLVFNNSKVRKARLFGISENSKREAEFLLVKKLDDFSWQVIAKRSGRMKRGSRFVFSDGLDAGNPIGIGNLSEVSGVIEDGPGGEGALTLRFDYPVDDKWLDRFGHIPLPPYIKRPDTGADAERYQTVYAAQTGSSAAPTAGLHFTRAMLAALDAAGIETAFITLHVGLGTFLPVRSQNIEDHKMHEEIYEIDGENASKIEKAKRDGRKVVAVGTTSVRTLESAWIEEGPDGAGRLKRGEGSTSIFIYPGYRFKAADALFTNFHTPESTLLMLVSAFAGKDFILESYAEAVKEGYRFFSYGDACLIK